MQVLQKLIDHQNLTQEETEEIMLRVMSGELTDVQIAGFLVALQSKGSTLEEITGCAKIMREKSEKINPKCDVLVDTCGTGGDLSGTFNISTTVALVVASCGVKVAKHGNKAASSQCGSADLLQSLGVKIDLKPKQVEKCIEEVGIGFMFAPLFHPAMKYVMPVRKELGVRTVFNILGPLTNPALAQHQVIGVFDSQLAEVLALVLKNLGSKHVLVVHGDGLDEITLTGETQIVELKEGEIKKYVIKPEDFGFSRTDLASLKGGSVAENTEIVKALLQGGEGPKKDIVLLNSAAVLLAADQVENLSRGVELAKEALESGKTLKKLEEFKKFTNSFQ